MGKVWEESTLRALTDVLFLLRSKWNLCSMFVGFSADLAGTLARNEQVDEKLNYHLQNVQ